MKPFDEIPGELLKKMKEQLEHSASTGREMGFFICKRGEHLFPGKECVGSSCAIHLGDKEKGCPPGSTKVGFFHTHPTAPPFLSVSDICSMLKDKNEVECVGSVDSEFILCAFRKDEPDLDKWVQGQALRTMYKGAFYRLDDGQKVDESPITTMRRIAFSWTRKLMREKGLFSTIWSMAQACWSYDNLFEPEIYEDESLDANTIPISIPFLNCIQAVAYTIEKELAKEGKA